MVTFLSCDAKVKYQLQLDVDYQSDKGKETKSIIVDSDTEYKLSIADNEYGLVTYNCRITGFTMQAGSYTPAIVNRKTKLPKVDTLTIDYSEDGESHVRTINVADIRYIEAYTTKGMYELSPKIPDFK